MRHYISIVFICILTLISLNAQGYPQLITFTENRSLESALLSDIKQYENKNNVIFAHKIMIDTDILAERDTVELQLDGENIAVFKIYSTDNIEMDYLYNTYESENAHVYISKLGNNIQGIIHSSSGFYTIDTYGDSYILEKINMDDVPEDAEPLLQENIFTTSLSREVNSTDTAHLRILVMYTPEALPYASNMINKVYLEINNGNTSFNNSDIKAKFEIAYVGQTEDSESGFTFSQLLSKYRINGDGLFDEVHTLRNRYSADICVLLVKNYEYCGKGYVGASANTAFAVVNVYSACSNKFSFTHEIGHNVGCTHDTIASPSTSYNHGYQHYIEGDNANSWRTMMAYDTLCFTGCRRIPYWSNPNINYNGFPTGTITRCDNARVWNENAIGVSHFRPDSVNIRITNTDNSSYMDYAHWRALQTIVVDSGYAVNSGQIVKLSAANSITLRPSTKINAGAKFLATNVVDDNPTLSYPQFLSRQHGSAQHEFDTQQEKSNVFVSPNPAFSNVNITLNLKEDMQSVSISILDISGQLQQKVVQAEILQRGSVSYPVDVSSYANGMFFVVVEINDMMYVNKIIKQ
ncbi:MAG: zinc-dependent metalloprotease [Paludibacteraceae bacterium]|nr:zinc-dependent metalloprotease [Paludibacteraceae bacterium]